ncbi:dihydrolipoyl dehydrogenase [Isoalcanivorax beigongshangi]|uniref:Dihydrolipoyl dehydrogenase n=1 Tax=Isoalcanivorax beigongshangi TaxID=3238810 RepID=A0ABV4AI11_9GAMM
MRRFKLVVIGAGTAGLTALNEARRVTDDVLLINHGPYGTTCARVGCMPSKALLAVSHGLAQQRFLQQVGVQWQGMDVDVPAVMAHVRRLRDGFIAGPIRASAPAEHSIHGAPRFLDANTLEVNGERIHADATVIATGSSPVVPAPWREFGERVVTTDEFFELEHPGQRVAVIGLGAIGAELGQGLAQLGLQVEGFSRGSLVGGLTDAAISTVLADSLAEVMTVTLGHEVNVEAAGNGLRVRAGDREVEVDRALLALGRRPNLDGLGLDQLVTLDERGRPPLHPHTLQVAELPIYLAGDVAGLRPLMHEAADEGRIAAWHALHPEAAQRYQRRAPLGIVFTRPNAARVGLSRRELPEHGVIVAEQDFSRQARAGMEGFNRGRLHLYVAADSGELLGAEMAIAAGEHIAHLLAWCMQQRLTVGQMLHMPFYHPVVEEGLRSALQQAAKQLGERAPGPDLPQR